MKDSHRKILKKYNGMSLFSLLHNEKAPNAFLELANIGVFVPYSDSVIGDKSILLTGDSFSGKTTIGNLLINNNSFHHHCEDAPTLYYNDNTLYAVETSSDPDKWLSADFDGLIYPQNNMAIVKGIFYFEDMKREGPIIDIDLDTIIFSMFRGTAKNKEARKHINQILDNISRYSVPSFENAKIRCEAILEVYNQL